jgi:hypothetical protein
MSDSAIGLRRKLIAAAIAKADVPSLGNLGLGTAATHTSTDFDAAGAATSAQSTAESFATGAASTAQSNAEAYTDAAITGLGLGTAATHAATDFDAAGAAATAQSNAEAFATAGDAPDIDATIQTTDGTSNVVAATYTPAHNSLVHVEGRFFALSSTGTEAKTRTVTGSFLTDNSGNVTLVGGSTSGGDTHGTSGATAWTNNLQTDGTVVQFVVTGASSTTINWRVIGEVTAGP